MTERNKIARELYPDPLDTGSPTLDAINRHSMSIPRDPQFLRILVVLKNGEKFIIEGDVPHEPRLREYIRTPSDPMRYQGGSTVACLRGEPRDGFPIVYYEE